MESSNCKHEEDGEWKAEEAIGGNAEAVEALRELIVLPFKNRAKARNLGFQWKHGLLLYGPPGTGKTSLVRAFVRESGAHLTVLNPHSVYQAVAGESEKVLREAFAKAASYAKLGKPSVIFIDEIDALCPRRDVRKEQSTLVSTQLLMLMDSYAPSAKSVPKVVVIGSTNRLDAIDPALRRPGRLDKEVEVSPPTEEERFKILSLYAKKVPLDPLVDLRAIAASCNGYVGADLESLCTEAVKLADKRVSDIGDSVLSVTSDDWDQAKLIVGPSITRGVTVEIPKVSWDDIGGLQDLKKKLVRAVEWPIKHADALEKLGVSPIRGILLHGPPGCSKTTLAKAAAHAAQASFFSLCGADLFSMYVGEGEALLRNTFRRASMAAPSIIFFDEADVVAGKRGDSSSNSSIVGERLLSTLLTEMDGLEQAKGILVLAATNRPHAIDAALMRPGRFDLVLYVPPPDKEARYEILKVHTSKMALADDVDLHQIAEDTDRFTGAELVGLCKEAGIVAMREDMSGTIVRNRHIQYAKNSLRAPALTQEDILSYSAFSQNPSLESSTPHQRNKSLLTPANAMILGVVSSLVFMATILFKQADQIQTIATT
ncbi:unnamed protein product [Rhodiola kirilowii]